VRAFLPRSRLAFVVAGVLTAALVVLVARRAVSGGEQARAIPDTEHLRRPAIGMPIAARPVAEAGAVLAAIGPLLSSTPEAANDVVFLTVAAAYGRCAPAHAHELGVMAARARLPVLSGLTGLLGPQTGSRAAVLAGIRELAARMPCDGPVDLSIGPFRQQVDIHAYAASFPDSYFEPTMPSASIEVAGRSLAERANDECNGVAYAVLPLDAPRAWQCAALRADARRRVAALCGEGGVAAAQQIRDAVTRLPSTCQ
jgi:hypothetical protein